MDRLQRLLGSLGGASMAQPGMDTPTVDSSEVVHISSLALLKVKLKYTLYFNEYIICYKYIYNFSEII